MLHVHDSRLDSCALDPRVSTIARDSGAARALRDLRRARSECRVFDSVRLPSERPSCASHYDFRLLSRICGSQWRFPAAGGRVRYAWRPAATRAGGSKLVAAARPPAAGKLVRLRRRLVVDRFAPPSRCNVLITRRLHPPFSRGYPQILLRRLKKFAGSLLIFRLLRQHNVESREVK